MYSTLYTRGTDCASAGLIVDSKQFRVLTVSQSAFLSLFHQVIKVCHSPYTKARNGSFWPTLPYKHRECETDILFPLVLMRWNWRDSNIRFARSVGTSCVAGPRADRFASLRAGLSAHESSLRTKLFCAVKSRGKRYLQLVSLLECYPLWRNVFYHKCSGLTRSFHPLENVSRTRKIQEMHELQL